jgi:hypothetical protein
MENKLYTFEEVVALIKQGFVLSLAGDEKILNQLPLGNWIGGTIPYFMDAEKGKFDQDNIFVNHIKTYNNEYKIVEYDLNTISDIAKNPYNNGYTILILPPFQQITENYAIQTESLENLYNNPITGWVAGIDLNSSDTPRVYNGRIGKSYTDKAVALHVMLPDDEFAQIEIVNIFNIEENNSEIKFYNNSFEVTNCIIDNKDTNFAKYLLENNLDTKLPLIADYSGALINVSIKEIDEDNGKVSFFAPVFKGKTYKFAKPINNYEEEFENKSKDASNNNVFSCNCVLNYLYGELEGKKINNVAGPITFGEIGYTLLNQTLVSLSIEKK